MEQKQSKVEMQIKEAEKERILIEVEKIRSEKNKIDLECAELIKQQTRPWVEKKEFWSVLIGTLIAWTAVAFYIAYSIVPLSQIENRRDELDNLTVKKENLRIKDSLELDVRQIEFFTIALKNKVKNLIELKSQFHKKDSTLLSKLRLLSTIHKRDEIMLSASKATADLQSTIDSINNTESSLGLFLNDSKLDYNLRMVSKNLDDLYNDLKAHPGKYVNLSVPQKK